MSEMPQQRASTDVHRELGQSRPATFDDLREELRSLSALVHEQQRALEQIGAVESEAVALTRSLPDRLGSAIAAAIEARQASFLLESERAASSLKAALRDLAAHSEALATRVGDRRTEITDAAARVLDSAEQVGAVAERSQAELERLEGRIAELPEVTGAVVDDRVTELRERLTRLSEQLERQEGVDIGSELRSRMEQVRAGLLDAVRAGVGEEVAEAVRTITERIDDAASSAPAASFTEDRVSEQVTAGLAPTLDELRQSVSALVAREDPAPEMRERISDLASQLEAVEERLGARVQAGTVDERLDDLQQLVVGAIGDGIEGVVGAIGEGIEGLRGEIGEVGRVETVHRALADLDERVTESLDGLAEAHAPLDDLHASVQRLAAVIRELATRDETAVTVRLDAIAQRIADLSARPEPTDTSDALRHLADRVDELARTAGPDEPTDHSEALKYLADRVDELVRTSEQLASPADLRAVLDHVAGARIAGEQSAEVASVMAQRVDDRLDELAARIAAMPPAGGTETLDRLEARVDDLAATLQEVAAAVKKLRRPPLRAKRKPPASKKKA